MKTVSFSIRPFSEVMGDFAKTFEAVQHGRRIPKEPREEVGFTSLEAARNFLTRERLALLRTIQSRHPGSLYELAKMVGRDFKMCRRISEFWNVMGWCGSAKSRAAYARSKCRRCHLRRLPCGSRFRVLEKRQWTSPRCGHPEQAI
jgi:hypothetical protein